MDVGEKQEATADAMRESEGRYHWYTAAERIDRHDAERTTKEALSIGKREKSMKSGNERTRRGLRKGRD